jgi:thioesterase domain-containing protein/acyl carrier protein
MPVAAIKIAKKTFSGVLFRSALGQVSFEIQYTNEVYDALSQNHSTVSSLYEELVYGVGRQVFSNREQIIENMGTHELLQVKQGEIRTVQLILNTENREKVLFQIFSTEKHHNNLQSAWQLHASGVLRVGPERIHELTHEKAGIQTIQSSNINGAVPDIRQQLQHTSTEEHQKVLQELISFEIQRVMEFQTPTEFGEHQKLTDLGLDSLMAVELANRLGVHMGCPFPPLMIEQYPTIASLAHYLVTLLADSAPETLSPLLALQDTGRGLPFFCVPGIFGTTSILHDLAQHLGAHQPFYALQTVDITPIEERLTGIEEIATFYNEAIRQMQPQGPYVLSGWSFGGVVAFEMASQFRARGQEVALLAMIDTPLALASPQPGNREGGKSVEEVKLLIDAAKFIAFGLGKHLTLSVAEVLRLTPDERENAVMGRVVDLGTTQAERQYIRSIQKKCKENLLALRNYTPKIYDQEILFFQARQKIDQGQGIEFTDEFAAAWQPYCMKPLQVYSVPGNHFTMMKDSCAQQIASYLQQRLHKGPESRI